MPNTIPAWVRPVLVAAAIYNLAWGTFVIFFPNLPFAWAGMEPPNYVALWQCIGMIVGVYGVGYWIASRDPVTHWPIVLVGLLGKILGPIGMAWHVSQGTLPVIASWTCVFNDVIWWLPFTGILFLAARELDRRRLQTIVADLETELRRSTSSHGRNLWDLSQESPLLVLFIRHSGCTFCREALARLKADEPELTGQGIKLAVVHMGDEATERKLARTYDLESAHWVPDPERRLYAACDLRLGTLNGLIGVKPLTRALFGGAFFKHGVGVMKENGLQLGGAVLLHEGRIVKADRYTTSADTTDFAGMCRVA